MLPLVGGRADFRALCGIRLTEAFENFRERALFSEDRDPHSFDRLKRLGSLNFFQRLRSDFIQFLRE